MNTENLNLFEKDNYTVSLDSSNENKFVISVENSYESGNITASFKELKDAEKVFEDLKNKKHISYAVKNFIKEHIGLKDLLKSLDVRDVDANKAIIEINTLDDGYLYVTAIHENNHIEEAFSVFRQNEITISESFQTKVFLQNLNDKDWNLEELKNFANKNSSSDNNEDSISKKSTRKMR